VHAEDITWPWMIVRVRERQTVCSARRRFIVTMVGERVIATYKTVKGALQLALAAAVVAVVLTGRVASLHDLATTLGHRASRVWSIALAHAIVGTITPHRLNITALALALDGVLTSIEGWALRRGHAWGRWTVVVATGLLMPFELVAFAHKRHWTELAAFVLNFAIVAYLARRALAHHREAKAAIAANARSA